MAAGNGFRPGETLRLGWDGAVLEPQITVDASGAFATSIRVPAGADPGSHAVEVLPLRGNGRARAVQAIFRVTAAEDQATATGTVSATDSPSGTPAGPTPPSSVSPSLRASPSATQSAAATPPPAGEADLTVSPGQDLGAIVNGAPDGGVVLVESGTYAPFVLTNSHVTVRAAPGHSAVISGGVDAMELVGVDDVTIEGLTVRGAIEYGIDVRDSTNVRIRSVSATRNGTGMRISGWQSHDVSVEGSALHTNDRMIRNTCGGNDDFGANGIKFHETNGPHSITGSTLFANRATSCDYGTDGGAFEIWKASNITIAGNQAYDNNVGFEVGTAGGFVPTNIRVIGNSFWTSPANTGRSAGLMIRAGRDSLYQDNTFRNVDWWVFFIRNCVGSTFCASIEGTRVVGNRVDGTAAYKIKEPLPASVVIDRNQVANDGGAVAEYLGSRYTSWLRFSQDTGYDASTAR
jgi:hypothetical protein